MRVTLEIDDNYAGILSITAIRGSLYQVVASAHAADLTKHNWFKVGADGRWVDGVCEDNGERKDNEHNLFYSGNVYVPRRNLARYRFFDCVGAVFNSRCNVGAEV